MPPACARSQDLKRPGHRRLCSHDLIGILDPFPRNTQGQLVGKKSSGQGEIDRKRQALRRGEHELGTRTRKVDLLRECPHDELRLPAAAELGLDPQRPAALLDIPVEPTHHIPLERRQHGLPVPFEHQRARLVQTINERLAEPPTEGSAQQPLKLNASRLTYRKKAGETRLRLSCTRPRQLKFARRKQSPTVCGN